MPPMPVMRRPTGIHAQRMAMTAERKRFATPTTPTGRFGQSIGPSGGMSVTSVRVSGMGPVTGTMTRSFGRGFFRRGGRGGWSRTCPGCGPGKGAA